MGSGTTMTLPANPSIHEVYAVLKSREVRLLSGEGVQSNALRDLVSRVATLAYNLAPQVPTATPKTVGKPILPGRRSKQLHTHPLDSP